MTKSPERMTLLQKLTLGNSVAEFDRDLDRYFLQTDTFRLLVEGEVAIIAGDKGSGKTALYRYVSERCSGLPALANVSILPGFNPAGSPVFQRLTESEPLTEGQYTTVWKAYFLSLVGNWALQFYAGSMTREAAKLDAMLKKVDLRDADESVSTIFGRIAAWVRRRVNPASIGIEVKFDHSGLPVLTPQLLLANEPTDIQDSNQTSVRHEECLELLDSVLGEIGTVVWLFLDRLDEAFLGYPNVEIPALRALLRTHLDLLPYKNIRLKIFLRRDLLAKISRAGFVNLTHINAKRTEIKWNEEDLFALICRRIKRNEEFLASARDSGLAASTDEELFGALLPSHLDPGPRRQTTWSWMLSHTRDGNNSIQPRNLIDLVRFAQEEQLRREQFSTSHKMFPLLGSEAMKRAFSRLSKQRVEDTLLAEATKEVAVCIEGLRDGKSEHNDESLAAAFGVGVDDIKSFADVLRELGFLEKIDGCYRVPILYREGLNITQGKAYRRVKATSPSETS